MSTVAGGRRRVPRAALWLGVAALCAIPSVLLASWWATHLEARQSARVAALASAPAVHGGTDPAIGELEKLATERPWDPQVQYSLGVRLVMYDRNLEAVRALARAAALNPASAATRAALGVAMGRCGRDRDAETQLLQAIALNPRLPFAQSYLGRLYFKYEQWARAEEHLRAAADLNPNDLEDRYLMATCYEHLYQEDKKLAILEYLVKKSPNDLRFLRSLGLVYLFFGKFADGEAIYRRVLQMAPNDPEAHYLYGRSLAELANTPADFARAEQELTPVEAAHPDQPGVHVALGILYFRRNDAARAVGEFEKAVAARSPEEKTLWYLGQSYLRAGQAGKGRRTLAEFGRVSGIKRTITQQENRLFSLPEDTPQHRAEKDAVRLNLARAYMQDADYAHAIGHLEVVRADRPADASVLALLAQCNQRVHSAAAPSPSHAGGSSDDHGQRILLTNP